MSRIDRTLTRVSLGAEQTIGQYSWRLARLVRRALGATHEALLHLTQMMGDGQPSLALVSAALARRPKALPRYPSVASSEVSPSRRAQQLLQGRCALANGSMAEIEHLSWLRDPFGEKPSIEKFLFHGLDWVSELVQAYHATRDRAYLVRAREIAERWIEECLYVERFEKVWDDHATGIRAVALCQLWVACAAGDSPGSRHMQCLMAALVRHADKLATPGFYLAEHNHGVTQGYALVAIGVLCSGHPRAAGWLRLGVERLEAQMDENVSAEGVHLEHSPYYHFYVLQQMADAFHFGRAHGVQFSRAFCDRLDALGRVGTHMRKPDGTLPAFGDTARSSPVLAVRDLLWMAASPSAGHPLAGCMSGRAEDMPSERSVWYPGGGYAFLRSGRVGEGAGRDERFVAIRTATFPRAHRHHDLLSFELYAYGNDLVVDSGGPFGYGHPLRQEYFVSTAAHNTVFVDGLEQQAGKSTIHRWAVSPACDVLDVEHVYAPGISHRRAFLFIRSRYLVVLDQLRATAPHTYRLVLHLDPSLAVISEGISVRTRNRQGGATLRCVPILSGGVQLRLERGAERPAQGWVCVGHRQKVPGSTLEYSRTGVRGTFATLLVPEPAGRAAAVEASIEGMPFEGACRLDVTVDGHRDAIEVPPTGEVAVGSCEA